MKKLKQERMTFRQPKWMDSFLVAEHLTSHRPLSITLDRYLAMSVMKGVKCVLNLHHPNMAAKISTAHQQLQKPMPLYEFYSTE